VRKAVGSKQLAVGSKDKAAFHCQPPTDNYSFKAATARATVSGDDAPKVLATMESKDEGSNDEE
jgi:hypothetical protein